MKKEFRIPIVFAVIAVISLSGIFLLGWLRSDSLTGNAVYKSPYVACCTVNPWTVFSNGYRQGIEATNTELCDPNEMPQTCCLRAGVNRFKTPVRLLDSRIGSCPVRSPELNYPADSFKACCTVQVYKRAPTGFIQGALSTFTESCSLYEDVNSCCARGGAVRMDDSIRVLGAKVGDCSPPEVQRPTAYDGFAVCCSGSSWRQSPTGYSQGEGVSLTAYCTGDSLSQCCADALSPYPVRFSGIKVGECGTEKNYPVWIR